MGSTPGVLISVVNAKQKHNLKYHYESWHGVVIHVTIVKYTNVELENAHDNMVRVTTGIQTWEHLQPCNVPLIFALPEWEEITERMPVVAAKVHVADRRPLVEEHDAATEAEQQYFYQGKTKRFLKKLFCLEKPIESGMT